MLSLRNDVDRFEVDTIYSFLLKLKALKAFLVVITSLSRPLQLLLTNSRLHSDSPSVMMLFAVDCVKALITFKT